MEIAKEILSQLGGNKFLAMTGCFNLIAGESHIAMHLRRNQSKATHLKIALTSMDLYDVTFLKVRAGKCETVKEVKGAYCDMLRDIFEKTTGMYTSL